jgi:hypothetical protein
MVAISITCPLSISDDYTYLRYDPNKGMTSLIFRATYLAKNKRV